MNRIPTQYLAYRSGTMMKAICLILLLLAFFGLKIFPIKFTQWDFPLIVVLSIVACDSIQIKSLYSKLIVGYVFWVFLSCIYSWQMNGQGIFIVTAHSYKFFTLLFFFFLVKYRLTAKEAETVLILVAIVCCCCYILQWVVFPTVLFYGADEESKANALHYRVRIPGSISCYILLLYGINKYFLTDKLKYFVYSLLGFIPIIVMGFRTLVALSLAMLFIMIPFVLRRAGRTLIYSILGAVIAFGAMQTDLVKSKLKEMERRTTSGQTFENDDYVRIREFDYYWNNYFNKPYEKVIGGGIPSDVTTSYRKNIYYNHYTWSDLGLVGLSMIIGIPAVVILILLYILCSWRFKEPQFQYLRFTLMIVLLGSSFTTAELFRDGNILLFSLILYVEYKCHRERKMIKLLPHCHNIILSK